MFLDLPPIGGGRACARHNLEFLLVVAWAAAAGGCLVDLDNRCGPHQRYDAQQGLCLCEETYTLVGNHCEACAENEIGSPDGCVCAEGFVRLTPDAECQAAATLGQACSVDADCGDTQYNYCRLLADGAQGYCTAADCRSSADCPGDYACNSRESRSFCERPPSGLGKACSSSDDCAGFSAGYCETVVTKSCVVNDCAADPGKCYGDWVCCDIGLLSQSLCVPPAQLENGACPAGGTLIKPEGG